MIGYAFGTFECGDRANHPYPCVQLEKRKNQMHGVQKSYPCYMLSKRSSSFKSIKQINHQINVTYINYYKHEHIMHDYTGVLNI